MNFKLLAGLALGIMSMPAAAATCIGTCGNLGADGVVTASPDGGTYGFVTTQGSDAWVGLGLGNERNGSVYTTDSFTGNAGDVLSFWFNYVTTDGAGYADYAWVTLNGGENLTLFTARTTPNGNTVPGFGMPAIADGVTLNPSTVSVASGETSWSPVGGGCYATGCGNTGWVNMTYALTTAGTYSLSFGVVNWSDNNYASGLAFDGATIGGTPIDPVPEPAAWAMMIAGFGLVGAVARRRRTAVAA